MGVQGAILFLVNCQFYPHNSCSPLSPRSKWSTLPSCFSRHYNLFFCGPFVYPSPIIFTNTAPPSSYFFFHHQPFKRTPTRYPHLFICVFNRGLRIVFNTVLCNSNSSTLVLKYCLLRMNW